MARADIGDGNGMLDKEEWLKFSAMLANLPEKVFNATIDQYTGKIKKINS